jgi:hypothetical protein
MLHDLHGKLDELLLLVPLIGLALEEKREKKKKKKKEQPLALLRLEHNISATRRD